MFNYIFSTDLLENYVSKIPKDLLKGVVAINFPIQAERFLPALDYKKEFEKDIIDSVRESIILKLLYIGQDFEAREFVLSFKYTLAEEARSRFLTVEIKDEEKIASEILDIRARFYYKISTVTKSDYVYGRFKIIEDEIPTNAAIVYDVADTIFKVLIIGDLKW